MDKTDTNITVLNNEDDSLRSHINAKVFINGTEGKIKFYFNKSDFEVKVPADVKIDVSSLSINTSSNIDINCITFTMKAFKSIQFYNHDTNYLYLKFTYPGYEGSSVSTKAGMEFITFDIGFDVEDLSSIEFRTNEHNWMWKKTA